MEFLQQNAGQIIASIGAAIGVYIGIRADISALVARVTLAEKSVDQAHARIDSLLQQRK